MRYRAMRWPCDYPVTVMDGAARMPATIVNVSAGGARLRLDAPLERGAIITIDLGNRRIGATVRWRRAGLVGLRLLTPLSKSDLAMVRHGRENADAIGSGRWNLHLREMR